MSVREKIVEEATKRLSSYSSRMWSNPDFSDRAITKIEDVLNEKSKGGEFPFYSLSLSGGDGKLDLRKTYAALKAEKARTVIILDHNLAERVVAGVKDPTLNDRPHNVARAVICAAPYLRAKVDLYISFVERSLHDQTETDYMYDWMHMLGYPISKFVSDLTEECHPNERYNLANSLRITENNPCVIDNDMYARGEAHLRKIVMLHHTDLNPIDKLHNYVDWVCRYLYNPACMILATFLFADKRPKGVWKAISDSPKIGDEKAVQSQICDMQYANHYARVAGNCETTGIIPIVFSLDAGLMRILRWVNCGTGKDASIKKCGDLLNDHYTTNFGKAVQAFQKIIDSFATHNIIELSPLRESILSDIERKVSEEWYSNPLHIKI